MEEIYKRMMAESRRIASTLKMPGFYTEHQRAVLTSKEIYDNNADVARCRQMIGHYLRDNLGHGMEHAEKVTIDVGVLVFVEGEKRFLELDEVKDAIVLAQLAGLLHDIKRTEANHAKASAREAAIKLRDFAMTARARKIIVQAISNHEAFVEPEKVSSFMGQMISDSLYDADKFRWGIDNFTETLWYMVDSQRASVESLTKNFSKGLESIRKIKGTFRTPTGKRYGPEFIDLGLEIGKRIYKHLLSHISSL